MHAHDPRLPIDDWVMAVHATIATAPVDVMKRLNNQMIIADVQARPDRMRESWGLRPEHQVTTPAERRFAENEQQR